jgi:short-subunit dehydrogenase
MKDKVIIITGATSGIGKACAFEYGRKGAIVAVTGRNRGKLDDLSRELAASNIAHHAILAEASSEADNARMVEETASRFGNIDALIANAGITMRALFEETELSVFRKMMDVNFYGAVYATKFALPYILRSKGSIIGISSFNGHRGVPTLTAYVASKFAMEGFYESLRTEVFKRGVHILVVSPSFVASDIHKKSLSGDGSSSGNSSLDESRMMSAEAVAKAIYKAHRQRKRDLVLTFQARLTIALNQWIPGILDNVVYNFMAKEANSPLRDKR